MISDDELKEMRSLCPKDGWYAVQARAHRALLDEIDRLKEERKDLIETKEFLHLRRGQLGIDRDAWKARTLWLEDWIIKDQGFRGDKVVAEYRESLEKK